MRKLVLAVSLCFVGTALYAETSPETPVESAKVTAMKKVVSVEKKVLIEKLDQDKDGNLTIKEVMGVPELLAAFGQIDTNGDGLISQKELNSANFDENKQGS